jgi:hypothetical protein
MFHTRFFNAVVAVALVGAAVLALARAAQPSVAPLGRASAQGQAIYHASEQDRAASPGLSAAGLAVYQASEHSPQPVVGLGMTAEGLGIYRASESGRAAALVPLHPHIAHPGR